MEIKISKKKPSFKISKNFENYLKEHNRFQKIPIEYSDLRRYTGSVELFDRNDENTLWHRVFYNDSERTEIDQNLKLVYNLLYSDGSSSNLDDLEIDSVDFCTFGNSNPFRIKVKNKLNDNFTYYYIKVADSSRIYGLELEHITSPNNLNYIYYNETLIEEHISGIPGDYFFKNQISDCSESEKSQIAKEFVKFSERCMIRLLGDMRSYNYVIVPIHDFDQVIYKIRAIDFDQLSYEGEFSLYRPQLFKDNEPIIDLVKNKLLVESINQYKIEERAIVVKRLLGSKNKIESLIESMKFDKISSDEKVNKLTQQIYFLTKDNSFKNLKSMGEVLEKSFNYLISNYENHEMLRINKVF